MGIIRAPKFIKKAKMKFFTASLLTVACLAGQALAGKSGGKSGSSSSGTSTDTSSDTSGTTYSSYQEQVKALIDSGATTSISSDYDTCGDAATSYYEEFEYNGNRVIISSGIPNHEAEESLLYSDGFFNPNVRCERWQYVVLPYTPSKASAWSSSDMGAVGWVSSGGVIYNHLSSTDGSLAAYYEIETLDTCGGHSNEQMEYHYHLIPYIYSSANDADACEAIGYMKDGYPVYGRCKGSEGVELESCWTQIDGTDGDNEEDFSYDSTDCYLDEVNGYTFSDGSYGYVLADNIFQTPIGYYGDSVGSSYGFTPSIA